MGERGRETGDRYSAGAVSWTEMGDKYEGGGDEARDEQSSCEFDGRCASCGEKSLKRIVGLELVRTRGHQTCTRVRVVRVKKEAGGGGGRS